MSSKKPSMRQKGKFGRRRCDKCKKWFNPSEANAHIFCALHKKAGSTAKQKKGGAAGPTRAEQLHAAALAWIRETLEGGTVTVGEQPSLADQPAKKVAGSKRESAADS